MELLDVLVMMMAIKGGALPLPAKISMKNVVSVKRQALGLEKLTNLWKQIAEIRSFSLPSFDPCPS